MPYIYFKYTLIAFISLFFLSGCSSKNINPNEKDKFITYDNTNHIIGEKTGSIQTLVYVEKINDKIDKKIIFYIDKFPYKQEFNLCRDKQDFKNIKAVNKVSGKAKVTYRDVQIDCKSRIYFNNNAINTYRLAFLTGFDVADFEGYDMLRPSTTTRTSNQFYVQDKSMSFSNNLKIEKYWYFEQ
jgi:hypothetical protein